MNATTRPGQSNGSAMMRLRLRLYPYRRYLKWLRRIAQWQMRLSLNDALQWRFCRWVSLLTTDPGERVLWRMPGTALRFYLDPTETIQMNLYYRQAFQPEIMHWVKQSLDPKCLFIDAGANVGIHSLIAADYYREELGAAGLAMVYAFEPNPSIFAQLENNICLNQLEGLTSPRQEAVSDREGWTDFYLSSRENSTSSSLAALGPAHLHTGETTRIHTVTLADFVRRVADGRCVGLIKLDIEGAELLALRGAQPLLIHDRPTIIMEVYPSLMQAFGYTFDDTCGFLTSLGYEIYRIHPDRALGILADGEWPTGVAYGDVICFPRHS